jgi:hypothetical protein
VLASGAVSVAGLGTDVVRAVVTILAREAAASSAPPAVTTAVRRQLSGAEPELARAGRRQGGGGGKVGERRLESAVGGERTAGAVGSGRGCHGPYDGGPAAPATPAAVSRPPPSSVAPARAAIGLPGVSPIAWNLAPALASPGPPKDPMVDSVKPE